MQELLGCDWHYVNVKFLNDFFSENLIEIIYFQLTTGESGAEEEEEEIYSSEASSEFSGISDYDDEGQ